MLCSTHAFILQLEVAYKFVFVFTLCKVKLIRLGGRPCLTLYDHCWSYVMYDKNQCSLLLSTLILTRSYYSVPLIMTLTMTPSLVKTSIQG